MGEESSSWVRRAKFSQTVYHKWKSPGRPSVRDCESDLKLKNLDQELKDRSSNLELKQKSSSSDLSISVTPSSVQLNSDVGLKPKASILEPSNDSDPVLKAKILNSSSSVLSNSSRVQSVGNSGLKTKDASLDAPCMLSVPFSFQPDGNPSKLQPRGSDLDSSDFSFYPGRGSGLNPKGSDSDNVSVSGRALPKRRSLSPLPTTILSDVFKEARSTGKRFSSPQHSRKDSSKAPAILRFSLPLPQKMAPFQHLSLNKASENLKTTLNFNITGSRMVSVASGSTKLHPNSHNSIRLTKRRDSKPKKRSKSPNPTVILSDAFKDARSIAMRFSTPPPGRKKADKTREPYNKLTSPKPPNSSPRHAAKAFEKLKSGKVSSWAKYFDNGEGRVSTLEITEKLTVDRSKLYLGLRFASGAYGRLYHGVYKDQPVAVKIIRLPDDDENGMMAARLEKHFIREVTFLSNLNHRNVIKLAGACENPPVFCIITEYLSGGSLRAFLRKLKQESLPLPKLIAISLDIAQGMAYIHSQGVIHRDLKPENILFDQDICVKIVDFGTACKEAYCDVSEDAGTYRWMAPEMIKRKAYGRKVDVYSFGLLLWEMVTGAIPYKDMTPIQAAFAVVNKNLRPVIPADCPAPLQALIEQCWDLDPEKRPEFSQIVKALEQFESDLACDGTLKQL